ncbi:hypothetical protein [Neisseria sicca]|uniref:hypothetical protein n=1 Tax=Neisseria sicca TaxID=490 RepID=UPI0028EF4493|nr:hypothetical protein [Neisseria sicca]
MGFAHEKHQQKGRLKPKIPFSDDHKTKARTPKTKGLTTKKRNHPKRPNPVQTAFPYSGIFRPTKPRAGTIC